MSDIRRYFETLERVEQLLPMEDQDFAIKLYQLMVRVERLTYNWPIFGGWIGVLLGSALVALMSFFPNFSAIGNQFGIPLTLLMIVGFYVVLFFIGRWLFKVLACNRWRSEALQKMKQLQFSDPRFNRILKILKETDPRIVKNIGKFLPPTDAAA